jgi:hypothetical protein
MALLTITGDTHGKLDIGKLSDEEFPEQKTMTRDDLVIIAGDFGAPWKNGEDDTDRAVLAFHESRNYTTLFVDGNHENFMMLATYPEVTFLGARCHQIREHVLHVERGEVIHTAHHRILCMGGACSTDKDLRIPGTSWWSYEVPDEREWQHCRQNLFAEQPDLLITHEAPGSVTRRLDSSTPDEVSGGMEMLLYEIEKNRIPVTDWYFGHHHIDFTFPTGTGIRCHALYQEKITLEQ